MAKRRCGSSTGGSRVQSLIFPRDRFTPAEAKAWAREHGYRSAIDEKPATYRMRQFDPGACEYRTVPFGGSGIKAVVEAPMSKAVAAALEQELARN